MTNMRKFEEYGDLVVTRKACHRCTEVTNPADIADGSLDSEQIGPWSRWQGNLDAALMVVGQDWGDTGYFVRHQGQEGPGNPTNLALVELVGLAGISIGDAASSSGLNVVFFTNAILCLKEGGLSGEVQDSWFRNCVSFLRRQVEIVHPRVVVGLGQRAYESILRGFGMEGGKFRAEVEDGRGRLLANGTRAFAVYHCGAWIQHTHRSMDQQRED